MLKRILLALLTIAIEALDCSAPVAAQPRYVQITVKPISRAAAGVLDKALAASVLEQPNTHPFHLRLEIGQTSGPTGDYDASIDETWYSPGSWTRTVKSSDFSQTVTMNDTGRHVQTTGDYFPLWLRNFVTAISTPVPPTLRARYNEDPLTPHAYDASGNAADLCQQYDFDVGTSPDMTNLALICFRPKDGLLDDAYEPGFAMSYDDYVPFNNLRVARAWREHINYGQYVEISGKITALESIEAPPPLNRKPQTSNSRIEKSEIATLSMNEMLSLSGGMPPVAFPASVSGHGKINAWINIGRDGVVREVSLENYDADYEALVALAQLRGRRWKPYLMDGRAIQAQGPIVFKY